MIKERRETMGVMVGCFCCIRDALFLLAYFALIIHENNELIPLTTMNNQLRSFSGLI